MRGFRSLAQDEEVEFESKKSDKGEEAILVTGDEGNDCIGSDLRPAPRRRVRKVRCVPTAAQPLPCVVVSRLE